MSKAEKRSYITSLWSIPAWIAIVFANLSFSYIFELDFSFDLFELVFIPTIILIFCFLGIKLCVLGIFNCDERKALRLNLIFFVLINGFWGTYICVTQPNIYNGFSVLFMFLIGPIFLNRVLGFKGTLIFISDIRFLAKLMFPAAQNVLAKFFKHNVFQGSRGAVGHFVEFKRIFFLQN